MRGIAVDAYVHVDPECPISARLNAVDETVEVTFGQLLGSEAVRLLLCHENTCFQLADVARQAGNMLAKVNESREELETGQSRPIPATPVT